MTHNFKSKKAFSPGGIQLYKYMAQRVKKKTTYFSTDRLALVVPLVPYYSLLNDSVFQARLQQLTRRLGNPLTNHSKVLHKLLVHNNSANNYIKWRSLPQNRSTLILPFLAGGPWIHPAPHGVRAQERTEILRALKNKNRIIWMDGLHSRVPSIQTNPQLE